MIKFKELRWSNAFSYAKGNVISLDGQPLTQLVGKNGHGKSSIALIIEEVLYNTNSKKIKKADILNRYSKDKNYVIELDFEKDGALYSIKTTRTNSSGSVILTKNGEDISSHTATGTYKSIENILGYDHKTFSQIVYQSSVSSLEFLTATDTARKTFLIELLNLTKYTEASEVFKKLASGMSKQVDATQAKLSTVQSWLAKYEKEDLSIKVVEEELAAPVGIIERVALINKDLSNITATNKKITQNNTYKKIFEGIQISTPPSRMDSSSLTSLKVQLATQQKALKDGNSMCNKHTGPTIKCPTCSQDMDNTTMFNMVLDFEEKKASIEQSIKDTSKHIEDIELNITKCTAHDKQVAEWEKYFALIDNELPTTLLNKDELESDILSLQASIDAINIAILKTRKANVVVAAHNSKVAVISAQMDDMRAELKIHATNILELADELTKLQILVKAFSTTGLVAYKIECLVKDLESITNEYLSTLADGRFQLSFKIASADKLNVVITDNGRDIDIVALSSGERARVNVATLLAIRKLMQTLSNSRTNLLILDETISSLDAYGKEKLIEVLLAEKSLNTVLVAHDYEHPLLEKIIVTKENNISRLDNV